MTNEELRQLKEKQDALGDAILQRAEELIKETYRLMSRVTYEPLDDALIEFIKGGD